MSKTSTIPVTAGAQLVTQPTVSLENVGPANFTRLINMRKANDQLVRREGWTTFVPTANPAAPQYTFDGAENLLLLAELIRGDGTRIVVGASKTLIKYFDTTTGTWVTIGSGFSASGLPWQAVALTSVLILNNGMDLPVTYEIGNAAVTPLYEARENGVASCGRIAEYNGFLFLGDVVEIKEDQLQTWMNGYASYTSLGPTAKAASFVVAVPGDNRQKFNVTTGAPNVVVTLPILSSLTAPFYIWVQKVDAAAGHVTVTPAIVDQVVDLAAINDLALIWWDGTRWIARVFAGGVIDATAPYGVAPTAIRQYIPDEQIWSDIGAPKNFAPLVEVVMSAASATLFLPFLPHNWVAGQTRLAVIGGGDGGGTLGGQSLYPDGVLITAIGAFSPANMGVSVTIEVTTDTVITYPVQVSVTRWTDVSTLVGKQRLGNGAKIISMFTLNGQQIISHDRGFFINRYTGNIDAPFILRDKYTGESVPMNGDCITAYNTQFVVYPTINRAFYQFDGISDPAEQGALYNACDYFFAGLADTDRIWAFNNPLTQELWFCRPGYALIYCYNRQAEGCSELDTQIDAACFCKKPGGSQKWLALGISKQVMVYGLMNGVPTTWKRNGASAVPQITSGLVHMGDQAREKMLHSYTPLHSSPSPDAQISVQLRATYNANAPLTDLLVPAEVLPDPEGQNFVATFFQATYFQDELILTDTRDIDWRVSGRTFEYDMRAAPGITRYTTP